MTLVVAVLLFTAGLLASHVANIWLSTGLAAAAVLLFCGWRLHANPAETKPAGVKPAGVKAAGVKPADVRLDFRLTPFSLASGVLVGVALVALTHLGFRLLGVWVPALQTSVAGLYRVLAQWPGLPAALAVLLLVVTAEEVLFRGLLYGELERRLSRPAAIVAASALYALPNVVGPSLVLVPAALGVGAVWTTQRAVHRSLAAPLVTHLLWDLGIFLIWPLV